MKSYCMKLLLFFGCSCLGLEAISLLLLINQDGSLSYDQIILHIILPITGVILLLIYYIWYNGYTFSDIISFIKKLFKKKKKYEKAEKKDSSISLEDRYAIYKGDPFGINKSNKKK